MRVMTLMGSKTVAQARRRDRAVRSSITVRGRRGAEPSASTRPGRSSSCCPTTAASVKEMLLDAITPRTPPAVVAGILDALGDSTVPARRGRTRQAPPRAHPGREDERPSASCSAAPPRPRRCSTPWRRHPESLRPRPRPASGARRPHRRGDPPAGAQDPRQGRRPAERRPPEGHRQALAADEEDRRPRQGQTRLREHLRQVPHALGRGDADRPRPDRHGEPPQGRTAHPHHGPEPVRRGQLPPVDRDDAPGPDVRRHARLGDADEHRTDRRGGQEDHPPAGERRRTEAVRPSRSCRRGSRSN